MADLVHPVLNRLRLRLVAFLLAASFILQSATLAAEPAGEAHASRRDPARPVPRNVVLIIADDLGYGDIGPYGGRTVPTPHLDRLAAAGCVFTQAHAPASTCTPSRYALMTGEYAWRRPREQTSILDGDAPLAIAPDAFTLPRLFQQAGRATALVGKWHLGLGDGRAPVEFNGKIRPGPLEVGFDHAFFIPATVDRVPCVFIEDHRVVGLDPSDPIRVSYRERLDDAPLGHEHPELLKMGADRQHGETIVNGISRIGHMSGGHAAQWVDEEIADTLAHRAREIIATHRDRPFFLYLGTHDPHVPRAPHPRFRGASNSGVRGDTIAAVDWLVGEVLGALDRHQLTDDTLVLFTSDNGPILFDGYDDGAEEQVGDHRPAGGLRGWKYQRYEGSTRVPFIVHWPGRVPAGRSSQLISLVDMLASFAALMQQSLPAGTGPDSVNLVDVLLARPGVSGRDHVVEQASRNDLALRTARWKYLPPSGGAPPAAATTSDRRPDDPRVRRRREDHTTEPMLFDLATDPGERRNVAAEHPDIVAELAAKLDAIVRSDGR